MTEQEIKARYDMIAIVWKYMKDRMENFEDTDEFWEGMVWTTSEMHKAHNENRFVGELLVAVYNEIARMAQARRTD